MPIPQYLQRYASLLGGNDTEVRFSISCTCQNPWLEVYENCLSEEDRRQAEVCEKACKKLACGPWGATVTVDEEGRQHHWKFLTPFGMKGWKKEIILPPAPAGSLIRLVKCRCPQCGKEFTLFDSLQHGYDAAFTPPAQAIHDDTLSFKQLRKRCRLEINVSNDTPDSNSFDWINIFAISEKGRKSTIFGWETA